MGMLESQIKAAYGNRLRVRVCGICITEQGLLLVHHKSLGKTGSLWAPPGGGMEYGEDARTALKREFLEETGLQIKVLDFLFVHEYLDPPLHGIELFFRVEVINGSLKMGTDPEMGADMQIITDIDFKPLAEIKKIPKPALHYVIQNITSFESFLKQNGYFKFN